jgi:hypothetical protein
MRTPPKLSLAAALTAVAVLSPSAVASARPDHHPRPIPINSITRIQHDIPVGAGATGDTPVTNEQCQAYADGVNQVLDTAQKVLQNIGNGPLYDEGIALARQIEDDAENVGCFIINPV